jgi:Ca2+/Na+ antiporter
MSSVSKRSSRFVARRRFTERAQMLRNLLAALAAVAAALIALSRTSGSPALAIVGVLLLAVALVVYLTRSEEQERRSKWFAYDGVAENAEPHVDTSAFTRRRPSWPGDTSRTPTRTAMMASFRRSCLSA